MMHMKHSKLKPFVAMTRFKISDEKVKEETRFKCKLCGDIYVDVGDAEWCCENEKQEEIDVYVCGVCDEAYDNYGDARKCCMKPRG